MIVQYKFQVSTYIVTSAGIQNVILTYILKELYFIKLGVLIIYVLFNLCIISNLYISCHLPTYQFIKHKFLQFVLGIMIYNAVQEC